LFQAEKIPQILIHLSFIISGDPSFVIREVVPGREDKEQNPLHLSFIISGDPSFVILVIREVVPGGKDKEQIPLRWRSFVSHQQKKTFHLKSFEDKVTGLFRSKHQLKMIDWRKLMP